MIQRVQSLYLLVVTVLLVLTMLLPIGYYAHAGEPFSDVLRPLGISLADGSHESTWGLFAILLVSAVVSLGTIFLFRNRMLQVRMTVFSSVLLVGYYISVGVFVFVMTGNSDAEAFRPGIALALPLVCIILNYLAFRAIYSDEVMVRAADRLRR